MSCAQDLIAAGQPVRDIRVVWPLLLVLADTPRSVEPPQAEGDVLVGELHLDGRLDEAQWQDVPRQVLRRQKLPTAGGPVTQPTSFRVLVGADAIYIAIRCEQAVPSVARRTRRDRPIESDRVHVDIDSRGRGKDAFHFEVTAGGSLVDGIRYNDTTLDLQWDGNWQAAVSHDAHGWSVEMKIPFRILRRPPGSVGAPRIQVRRYVSRLGQTDEWAPTPRDNSQEVARYGVVQGLELAPRKVMADLTPMLRWGRAPCFETGARRRSRTPRSA